jgi:hypothetical protein
MLQYKMYTYYTLTNMPIDNPSIVFDADVFSQMGQYPAGQAPKDLVLETLRQVSERAQATGVDLTPCIPIFLGTFAAFPYEITQADLAGIGISIPYIVR